MVRRYLKPHTYICGPHLFGLLFLSFCLAACSGETLLSASNTPAPEITKWVHSETDVISVLSEEPRECLPPSADSQTVLGRLAFRSPFLLGGQAARRGLASQSCHGQGQVNSHFFVAGLSDTPGTADVTSFHFSDELGDEVFNPVPIPSLADGEEGMDFKTQDLDIFVRRLITKEFTGPEPTPDVEAALLAYLRALDNTHCETPTLKGNENLEFKLGIISSSLKSIPAQPLPKASHNFMLAALRVELGRLHNRFPNHPKLQAKLIAISADLNSVKVENPDLSKIAKDWDSLEPRLRKAYESSLFNASAIQNWLETK